MPFGGGSIQVARVFGIRVGVNASWFLVLFIVILSLSSSFKNILGGSGQRAYVVAVASALLFYLSIVLHELGHALVARAKGIKVDRIDLWLFGGVAELRSQPETPGDEFAVAAAGPLVTLAVVIVCGVAGTLVETSSHFFDVATLNNAASASPAYLLLSFVGTMNAFLLLFNLVPGFPLDGGRIAFAAAWKATGDRNRALRVAGRMGIAFAYALGAFGLYLITRGDVGSGIWALFLAWFLAPAARGAILQGTVGTRLEQVTVAEVMDPEPLTIGGDLTLLEAQEQFFEHSDWPFVGVIDSEHRFLGVLTRPALDAELAAGRPALKVREIVDTDRMDWLIRTDQQLEDLLHHPSIATPGAVFAVDRDDFLRGVVTIDQLRRAITPAAGR
jgi:Zn-dependent protease/CBS domain-containing protein